MSTQTDAMKLALEKTLEMLNDNREYIEANERSEYLAMYDKAIASAEKALAEQPAQPASEADMQVYKAIADNYHASLQPAPVQGWKLVPLQPTAEMVRAYDEAQYSDDLTVEATNVWVAMLGATPQAQREFVGLTDEEIEQGCKESWVTEQAWQSAVWWAEDKLMEKNQ